MDQIILFLSGLPASGKSTWSKQFCKDNPNFIRINKDDIREMFNNPTFTRKFEDDVLDIQRKIGITALKLGKSLIVDDTNFSKTHKLFWESVILNPDFAHIALVEKFFDTPVEECIRRDSEREKSVGKLVILGMYNKYLKNNNSV